MKKIIDFKQFEGVLRHLAFDSKNSQGRRYEEDEEISLYGDFYDPFQLDIEKIRLGKFYRRLNDKTQVFPPEKHANIRNRQSHTNEVVSLSSFVASVLGLNKNLTEAIAYGHDIGHTAFGHLGERIISDISGKKFSHAVMSVVAAQSVERNGKGLNLCFETLIGMLNHPRGGKEMKILNDFSKEASLDMVSDKIAYIFSDLNDAFKVGCLQESNAPMALIREFGKNQRERIATTAYALIKESSEQGNISFSLSDKAVKFAELRAWMYKNVYHQLDIGYNRLEKEKYLKRLFRLFPQDILFENIDPLFLLSILTDSEAKKLATMRYSRINKSILGFAEIALGLNGGGREIDIFNHDLNVKDFKFHKVS